MEFERNGSQRFPFSSGEKENRILAPFGLFEQIVSHPVRSRMRYATLRVSSLTSAYLRG